jgi:hypothetical protein
VDGNAGLLATRYKQLGGSITPDRQARRESIIRTGSTTRLPSWTSSGSTPPDPAAQAWLSARGGGPQDAAGRPLIRKLGTVDVDLVETTPVVPGATLALRMGSPGRRPAVLGQSAADELLPVS